MKKIVFLSCVFFVAGVGLTVLVFANPFDWPWAQGIGNRLGVSRSAGDMTEVAGLPTPAREAPERRILYWVAPMDPAYIRDEPGKSPMGMDLIPVYEDEVGSTEGLVQIDPVFVQNIGVRTVEAIRADIPHTIRTVGRFTYDDSDIYWINTKYEGWIENVGVNYVGEEVSKGQRLFDIFSPQLVNTQQNYLNAVRYLERLRTSGYPEIVERARSLVESSRQRLHYWDVTDEQIAELEATGRPRRSLQVVSPVDGLVVTKMDAGLEGMLARPGMNLYQIADLSTIWVEAEIFEDDIPWLNVGQLARIEAPHRRGRSYTGTIRYIYPFLSEATRTLRLSIELPNPDLEFRAGMYADVTLEVPSVRNVIVIPEEAVIHSGERNIIVLDLGNGTFQVTEVTLGVHGNGLWEIQDSLSEGTRVVVSSQFLIASESNLREAIRKLISDVPATPPMETDKDPGEIEMDMEIQN